MYTRIVGFLACVLLGLFLLLIWLFGVEPQIMAISGAEQDMPRSTYGQYMEGSLRQNGDTIPIRILTTIVYPGAQFGRLIHNAVVD